MKFITLLFTCGLLIPLQFIDADTTEIPPINKAQKTSIAWTASWSFDDQFIAVGSDNGELSIYETETWKKIKSWKYDSTTITRVEWNSKYPVLAVASVSFGKTDSVIQMYDVVKDEIIKYRSDNLRGRGVTWSHDGEKVAFVGSAGSIHIFSKDANHLKTLSFRNDGSLFDIDWHPRKDLMLAVEENIYVIDITKDTVIATYDDGAKNKGILCCQWHTSGNFFVTADYGHENMGGEPSYLKYWSGNGRLIKLIKEAKFEYRNVKWTTDGKFLAATSDVLLLLDDKGKIITKKKFDDNNLWGVEWNHKRNKIVITDQVGNVRICDIKGTVLKSFKH